MSMKIERGDIWWINLDPTIGAEIKTRRPCVVLSANAVNAIRATPVVVPLSSAPTAAFPIIVSVPSAGAKSVAVLDQIRAVDKKRFVKKAGSLSGADLAQVELAAKQVLELP